LCELQYSKGSPAANGLKAKIFGAAAGRNLAGDAEGPQAAAAMARGEGVAAVVEAGNGIAAILEIGGAGGAILLQRVRHHRPHKGWVLNIAALFSRDIL
jgi:hypothetical protein